LERGNTALAIPIQAEGCVAAVLLQDEHWLPCDVEKAELSPWHFETGRGLIQADHLASLYEMQCGLLAERPEGTTREEVHEVVYLFIPLRIENINASLDTRVIEY
jgi:hypothetical protein